MDQHKEKGDVYVDEDEYDKVVKMLKRVNKIFSKRNKA